MAAEIHTGALRRVDAHKEPPQVSYAFQILSGYGKRTEPRSLPIYSQEHTDVLERSPKVISTWVNPRLCRGTTTV